jgi:hypothetical protein
METEKLKVYLEENSIETNVDLDVEELNKLDSLAYAEKFIELFKSFYSNFKDCKEAESILSKNRAIATNLLTLIKFKDSSIEFGKSENLRNLKNYLYENYFEINEFIDLVGEIYA